MRRNHSLRRGGGFTLIEMIITISIITLLATVAMPGLIQLFRTGGDSQTYNTMYAMLVNARARAIQNGVYAGVHCQAGDARVGSESTFYLGVVEIPQANMKNVATRKFEMDASFTMQELPGDWAFGAVDGNYASGGTGTEGYTGANFATDAQLNDFTTFTVAFSPAGSIVQTIPGTGGVGQPILFNTTAPLFAGKAVWTAARANGTAGTGRTGATVVCMFEYKALAGRDAADRAKYLDENAQALPINLYTGQLYDRK